MSARRNLGNPSPYGLYVADDIYESSYQKAYRELHQRQDPRKFADDVEAAILEFALKADDCGPEFTDSVRLPTDIQSGLGVVTSYIQVASVEKEVQVFRADVEAAVGRLKIRSAEMMCLVDHWFEEEQWAYPCPYESEDRQYPHRQHWLAEHFGTEVGRLYYADVLKAPSIVFPYEVSLQDDSLHGLKGLVDIGGTPLLLRRLLAIIGMSVFWARSAGDKLEGCLRRMARQRNLDGQKVLALPVGGVLEAMLRDLNMLDAADWYRSAFMDYDPVLCLPRSIWRLHEPVTSLLHPSFGSAPEFIPSLPMEEATEWNEVGCAFDKYDRKQRIISALCQQAVLLVLGCERMGLALDEFLEDTPYICSRTGDRVIKRSAVEDYMATIPSRFASLEYSAKRAFIVKAEQIYSGHGLMAALPIPESIIFPGELYKYSAGNCFPDLTFYNDDFNPYADAARIIGDAICCMREGFIKIALAFQQCPPRNLSYDSGCSPTKSVLSQAISVRKFNRKRKETVGADLVFATASRFMHYSSPQVGILVYQFPDDNVPRKFAPNYPDGQT